MSKFTVWLNPDSNERSILFDFLTEERAKVSAENFFNNSAISGDNVVVIENHDNPKYCPTVIFDKTKH